MDNSEKVYTVKTKPQPIKKVVKRTEHASIIHSEPVQEEVTLQDKKNHEKAVGDAFYKDLMYDTPEKTMKAIIYFQEHDQNDKAEEYIDYLIKKFPDYKYQ